MTNQKNSNTHEQARRLIAADRVEGLSSSERSWLHEHLDGCAECADEVRAMAAAIDWVRSMPVVAPADLVRRTRQAVRRRAQEHRVQWVYPFPFWVAVGVSAAWMLVMTPYTWWAFGAMGRVAGLPQPVWQMGFLTWWFFPATVLAALLSWLRPGQDDGTPGASLHRRQR